MAYSRLTRYVLIASTLTLLFTSGRNLYGQDDLRAWRQAQFDGFVRDVLRNRIAAGAIPDVRIVPGSGQRIRVRADPPRASFKLTPAALPTIPGVELELVSLAEAEAEAARSGERVRFITVRVEELEEHRGTVWIGGNIVFPPTSRLISACCCIDHVAFVKQGDAWVFEGNLGSVCA